MGRDSLLRSPPTGGSAVHKHRRGGTFASSRARIWQANGQPGWTRLASGTAADAKKALSTPSTPRVLLRSLAELRAGRNYLLSFAVRRAVIPLAEGHCSPNPKPRRVSTGRHVEHLLLPGFVGLGCEGERYGHCTQTRTLASEAHGIGKRQMSADGFDPPIPSSPGVRGGAAYTTGAEPPVPPAA